MDLQFHLPLWAILYTSVIFANAVVTIIISGNKSLIYQLSQLLSSAFMISFFFIYYGVIPTLSHGSMILILCFIVFQEVWVNKELYNRYIFDNIPKEEKSLAIGILAVLMLLFLLPLFFVVNSLF